jgi:hypothetical protein
VHPLEPPTWLWLRNRVDGDPAQQTFHGGQVPKYLCGPCVEDDSMLGEADHHRSASVALRQPASVDPEVVQLGTWRLRLAREVCEFASL